MKQWLWHSLRMVQYANLALIITHSSCCGSLMHLTMTPSSPVNARMSCAALKYTIGGRWGLHRISTDSKCTPDTPSGRKCRRCAKAQSEAPFTSANKFWTIFPLLSANFWNRTFVAFASLPFAGFHVGSHWRTRAPAAKSLAGTTAAPSRASNRDGRRTQSKESICSPSCSEAGNRLSS